MRVADLLVALIDREQPTNGEKYNRHEEGVDVTNTAEAEGMGVVGRLLRAFAADQQQGLIAGVCKGMNRFREHRG